MRQIGDHTGLAIRVWSSERRAQRPRLAICCTYVEHTPRAVCKRFKDDVINGEAAVVISNRKKLASMAE